MNSKLAIVTGVPGWLGTRFSELLATGMPGAAGLDKPLYEQIRILKFDRLPLNARIPGLSSNLEIIEGNLLDLNCLKLLFKNAAQATVFHLAGVIHPQHGVREFYQVNYEGTKLLADLALECQVKRFVYVSSDSAIGYGQNANILFDEKSPYNPQSNYGQSKMLAETYLLKLAQISNMEVVIVRPTWFYGPGQPARQSLFFKLVRTGKVPTVGPGENLRSMSHIDNVCQGLILCSKIERAKNQIYWIADEKPYSTNEIIATIERCLENDFQIPCTHKRIKLPKIVGSAALKLDASLQATGLYSSKIHVLAQMDKNIACKIDKAKEELGYCPKISLEEGMKESIKWAIEQGYRI